MMCNSMESWGSSYLLQDVEPVRLVGVLGAWTGSTGAGIVTISFAQEPGALTLTNDETRWKLVVKLDLALRLLALLHVLVLQNMLLRGETPEIRATADRSHTFTVTDGWRSSPITCSWDRSRADVECKQVDGMADQFELTLTEQLASEMATALAARIAQNGATSARGGSSA